MRRQHVQDAASEQGNAEKRHHNGARQRRPPHPQAVLEAPLGPPRGRHQHQPNGHEHGGRAQAEQERQHQTRHHLAPIDCCQQDSDGSGARHEATGDANGDEAAHSRTRATSCQLRLRALVLLVLVRCVVAVPVAYVTVHVDVSVRVRSRAPPQLPAQHPHTNGQHCHARSGLQQHMRVRRQELLLGKREPDGQQDNREGVREGDNDAQDDGVQGAAAGAHQVSGHDGLPVPRLERVQSAEREGAEGVDRFRLHPPSPVHGSRCGPTLRSFASESDVPCGSPGIVLWATKSAGGSSGAFSAVARRPRRWRGGSGACRGGRRGRVSRGKGAHRHRGPLR